MDSEQSRGKRKPWGRALPRFFCRYALRRGFGSAIAAENERAQDFQKRIQAPRPPCRTRGAALATVQVAMPVRPSPSAKGNLNSPLTSPRQSKPFRGSRLKPSKADSRCDQKGKHLATCPVEADSPCIPQGKRVPDSGSRDHKTTDYKTAGAT